MASKFGNYTFEINVLENDYFSYRADISQYSKYPSEEEVLFYPYSGFRVKNILSDARIIQLDCLDTVDVESNSRNQILKQTKLFDQQRQLYVYLYKTSNSLHFSRANNPTQQYLIKENPSGYWDSHYRYHHQNGYFLHQGNKNWEEYQNDRCIASFQQV